MKDVPLPVSDIQMLVESQRGFTLKIAGIPLVRGSWFQYFEPGWTKGYYSSNWNSQEVQKGPDGYTVRFRGADGRASGTQQYKLVGNRVVIEYEFRWAGEKPVQVELCAGMLWAPAMAAGSLQVDGVRLRNLSVASPPRAELTARTFGVGTKLGWQGPLGSIEVNAQEPLRLFDARGYDQEWAQNRELFWLGTSDLHIEPNVPKRLRVEFALGLATRRKAPPVTLTAKTSPTVISPDLRQAAVVPTPKEVDFAGRMVPKQAWITDKPAYTKVLREELALRWESFPEPRSADPLVTLRIDSRLPPEGFALAITDHGVVLAGSDERGWLHGLRLLPRLASPLNGHLSLAKGTLKDWPAIAWRGAHLFVGPRAEEFQQRLWTRVLLPMRLNHVILQCERTDWKSVPGIKSPITMPRESLARLFDWYRSRRVEPIPMIQSFGHMEWLFANGKNRDAAFNPEVLYSVDPRKPATRAILNAVWDEAVDLLKPTAIHFGLDEVNMRGWPENPQLVTDLWTQQLAFLGAIAERHRKPMMLWGDMALDKSEAPDAQNGDSLGHATSRRRAIPKGSTITDWHYRADDRPETFTPVLELWKREGFQVIASGWYRPENIRGLAAAAAKAKAGYLQTTWAGYESFEGSLFANFAQYSAFVRAGQAAWTGSSQEPLFNADEMFRDLMYGRPKLVSAKQALKVEVGAAPLELDSLLSGKGASGIEIRLPKAERFRALRLELETYATGDEGEAVGIVATDKASFPLLYGRHVRSSSDRLPVLFADSDGVLEIPLRGIVSSIKFRPLSNYLGLRIKQITVIR